MCKVACVGPVGVKSTKPASGPISFGEERREPRWWVSCIDKQLSRDPGSRLSQSPCQSFRAQVHEECIDLTGAKSITVSRKRRELFCPFFFRLGPLMQCEPMGHKFVQLATSHGRGGALRRGAVWARMDVRQDPTRDSFPCFFSPPKAAIRPMYAKQICAPGREWRGNRRQERRSPA